VPDVQSGRSMTVQEARTKKAELIRQVREGVGSWTPQTGWSDRFSDDEIWEEWRNVTHNSQLTNHPMMVAAGLVSNVIDGKRQ
jgi:hypothetical protein